MNNSLIILVIFWGFWIIIPVLFDGLRTFIYMIVILIRHPHGEKCKKMEPEQLLKVSVIIPAYNEEDNIDECLYFLKSQKYPHHLLEIIVVDNGSTDSTGDIVRRHIVNSPEFTGKIKLITRLEKGKAQALNTGIVLASGNIIINIDCRSFLEEKAIYSMVSKFVHNPQYGAVTGDIEINWEMIYERDKTGSMILNSKGEPIPTFLTRKEKFLAKSQFMEYLTSFRLGREFQDITDSMFTLSGAFSAFKREVLLKSNLYSSRTVCEDTDITLDLMGQNVRIGYCSNAKAFLKPVISLERFFAQRVRWSRGRIEVVGLHIDWFANLAKNVRRGFLHGLNLMIDHTFAFPRLVWTFLLPLFFIFGYSMNLILMAILIMWAFYVFIDFMNALFCWRVVDRPTKEKIKDNIQYVFLTPIFRLMTYFARFSAYLIVLKEPQAWTMPISPVKSTKTFVGRLYHGYNRISKNWLFRYLGLPAAPKLKYQEKIAESDDYGKESGQRNKEVINE